ncbi:MAG: hypothetical protein WAS55_13305 [Saprospiraceae bacterium]
MSHFEMVFVAIQLQEILLRMGSCYNNQNSLIRQAANVSYGRSIHHRAD